MKSLKNKTGCGRVFTWQALLSRILLLCLASYFVSACTTTPIRPNDPRYAPITPASLVPPSQNNGSIYQASHGMRLWDDRRAKRVGDVITVILSESTSSSKSASTDIDKASSGALPSPNLFGTTTRFGIPTVGSSNTGTLENSWNSDRSFGGDASSDQSNSLSGRITVTVSQLLPNGLLHIKGEKWLTLSRGEEYIRISGLIRQEDISPDNTVTSTQIADARIAYSGTGALADANRMGWLSRFFNSPLWPF